MSSGFNHEAMGRIGPIAVIDLVGTIAGALIFSKVTKISPWKTVPAALVLGEVAHVAAGVETPVTRLLHGGRGGI
jgi:hypothetical protein